MTDEVAPLLRELKPAGYGDTWTSEPWPEWRDRAIKLLPNFPEPVLAQWLYRHYTCAVDDWGWIGLPSICWDLESWSTEQVLTSVNGFENHGLIESWRDKFIADEGIRAGLGEQMIAATTWPVPIMVIKNDSELKRPDGLPLGKPFHLMEGYHRLGFLHALGTDSRWTTAESHGLYVARVDPKSVLDYWPFNDGA